jgi:chemotaxis family two-component system response regulator Rcp1
MKVIGTIDLGDGEKISDVLLVEDSPGDVQLTQEVFRAANPSVNLHVANDGVEAMTFLRRRDGHSNSPRPDAILLDLNMPRMDGRQVLAEIQKDDKLRTIPTVILTTSEADVDVAKSYQLQANRYLTKPAQLDAFEDVVKSSNEFWLTTVKLPQKRDIACAKHFWRPFAYIDPRSTLRTDSAALLVVPGIAVDARKLWEDTSGYRSAVGRG